MEELIQLKLDGELDAADAATLERHLSVCSGCQAVADQYEALDHSLLFHIRVEEAVPQYVPKSTFIESLKASLDTLAASIERALLIKPRYQLAMAAIAVVLLIAAVPVFLRPGMPGAVSNGSSSEQAATVCAFNIKTVKPSARVGSHLRSAKEIDAYGERALSERDYIVTGSSGSVELAYNQHSTVRISSDSQVRLGDSSLQVTRGGVWMDHHDGDFEISSPTARLGVMGTIFGMEVQKNGSTTAYCEDGQIWVRGINDIEKTFVTAGKQVIVSQSGTAAAITAYKSRHGRLNTHIGAASVTDSHTGTGSTSDPASVQTGEGSLQVGTDTLLMNIVDDTEYIYGLYRSHHNRNPKSDELHTLLKALESGEFTRQDIEKAVLDQDFFRRLAQKFNH